MGLPACTTANGCFDKVDQNGAASPMPAGNGGWAQEESLDLDAVSALCPNCHILLVEATDNGLSNLHQGDVEAAALGANQISNSWAGGNSGASFTFPGVAVLAATGDGGYNGNGDAYPAALPDVTAVGGTSVAASTTAAPSSRGFGESAWAGGGAGCVLGEAKPSYQTDTGCTGRSYADVSADANPNTGLVIYGAGSWQLIGGTSLATPLAAAYEALTGVSGATPQWAYADSALLNDPATGSDGSCNAAFSYMCNARAGYDGPTGAGSISGAVVTGAPGIGGPSIGTGSGNTYTQTTDGFDATLAGGIYPNGLATTYVVQYGTTTSYGQSTTSTSIGSGTAPVSVSVSLTGLSPSTTYHYRLVATNSDGTSYGYDSTLTTSTASPLASVKPTVSGSAATLQTLSASNGTWSNTPTSYTYQWQIATSPTSGWSNIGGQTASTYTLAAGDAGASVRVGVTASNSFGSTTAYSGPAGPVVSSAPVVSVKPVVSGTASVGSVISTGNGTWSNAPTSYTYQWQIATSPTSGWSDVSGQTGSTYTLALGDAGASFRVGVTASNGAGTATAYSGAVGPVISAVPAVSTKPTVSGNPWVGQLLSATSGGWSPAATTYAYQWQIATSPTSGWSNVSGATGSTLALPSGDVGASLRVGVTAANASGSATAYSGPVGPVGSGVPVATSIPAISGSARVGQVLAATSGAWSPAGTSYAYQWQIATSPTSGWSNVGGATSSTYTLRSGDHGASFRVVVTAANGVGSANSYSSAIGPVQ